MTFYKMLLVFLLVSTVLSKGNCMDIELTFIHNENGTLVSSKESDRSFTLGISRPNTVVVKTNQAKFIVLWGNIASFEFNKGDGDSGLLSLNHYIKGRNRKFEVGVIDIETWDKLVSIYSKDIVFERKD